MLLHLLDKNLWKEFIILIQPVVAKCLHHHHSLQITKKWKNVENNLFSLLEIKAEITCMNACVSP